MTLIEKVLRHQKVGREVFDAWLRSKGMTKSRFSRSMMKMRLCNALAILGVVIMMAAFVGFMYYAYAATSTDLTDHKTVYPIGLRFVSLVGLGGVFLLVSLLGLNPGLAEEFSRNVAIWRVACNCGDDEILQLGAIERAFRDELTNLAEKKLRAQIVFFNGRKYGEKKVRGACKEWEKADAEWEKTSRFLTELALGDFSAACFAQARLRLSRVEQKELDG